MFWDLNRRELGPGTIKERVSDMQGGSGGKSNASMQVWRTDVWAGKNRLHTLENHILHRHPLVIKFPSQREAFEDSGCYKRRLMKPGSSLLPCVSSVMIYEKINWTWVLTALIEHCSHLNELLLFLSTCRLELWSGCRSEAHGNKTLILVILRGKIFGKLIMLPSWVD